MVQKNGLEDYYVIRNQKKLRFGYTTGSCAAGAARGAVRLLLGEDEISEVELMTPKGILLHLEILDRKRSENAASCAVRKDAGDDPDTTNGILVYAKVEKFLIRSDMEDRIVIDGGIGVGRVTKPGLSQKVGEAAINPVPRAMILQAVEEIADQYHYEGGLKVTISVPEGEKIARKTFNPRLGIVGGISILGTSGIVEPMSEKALTDTIQLELHQKHVAGLKSMILTPGNYGESFLRDELNVNLDYAVKCSNFIGDSLDMAVQENIGEVLLVGHGGKLIKLAAGVMNTHSSVADGRMETLAAWGGACGAGPELIREILESVTVDQGLKLLETVPGLREKVMEQVVRRAWEHLTLRAGESMKVECILFTNERGILGMSPGAMDMLKRILAQDMTKLD